MKFWSPGVKLADIERTAIEEAYAFHAENKTKTAEALGISIRTLDKRLAEFAKKPKHEPKTVSRENAAAEFAHGGLRAPFHPFAEGHAPDGKRMVAEKVLNKPDEAFGKEKPKPNGKAQTVQLTHAPKKK